MGLLGASKYLVIINKQISKISLVAGLVLALLGFLLLTDTYRYVNSFLFEVAFKWGYEIK